MAGEEAVDVTGRQLEDDGGLIYRQATVHYMLEHERAMLGPCVGLSLSVLRFHGPEADKVAGRLARTESLAVHTSAGMDVEPEHKIGRAHV